MIILFPITDVIREIPEACVLSTEIEISILDSMAVMRLITTQCTAVATESTCYLPSRQLPVPLECPSRKWS